MNSVIRKAVVKDIPFILTELRSAARQGDYIDLDAEFGKGAFEYVVRTGVVEGKFRLTKAHIVPIEYWIWEMTTQIAVASTYVIPGDQPAFASYVEIHDLVVSEPFQRRGHGERFLIEIMKKYPKKNFMVRLSNKAVGGKDFCLKMGFREEGGVNPQTGIEILAFREGEQISVNN